MSELHIVVLWEYARHEEDRILKDLARRLEIVRTEVLSWPGDPEACFGRFYGANLADARGKVLTCGGGAFRLIIVRDSSPRYGLVETSRGLESANLNLFDLKTLYREWTGGGHKVHTTNTITETAHDIFLLTGHTVAEWENGCPEGDLTVLPGQDGWNSLLELFTFLGRFMPYAILRNAEMLPDTFDPSLHGDIDLLVEDAAATVHLLGARKVFPEPHRVHYEVTVAGKPVRFDFRFIGDNYYDTAWERRMLERRISANGICLLHPEDAFFALVYHALYQKFEIAADYVEKAAALAKATGIEWTDYADALTRLEKFLAHNGYGKKPANDSSVRWNGRLASWQDLADEMSALSGVTEIRPALLESTREGNPLRTSFFSGRLNGKPCFIKYSPYAKSLNAAEWRYPQLLAAQGDGTLFETSLFWHTTPDGGSFSVTEWIEGESLDTLIVRKDRRLVDQAGTIVADLLKIATALERAKIVHRDIRPANLIVSANGHVKLIDFQFAAPYGDGQEDPWFNDNPEVIDGLGADYALHPGQWNDSHSLRKTLSELPVSSARDRALDILAANSDTPTKVAACSARRMRRLKRRRACLKRKSLATLLSPRKRAAFVLRYTNELDFLDRAIATWHVM